MKLIIDIPEETYNKMRRGEALYPADANVAIFAIETGTPLSESEDCISRANTIDEVSRIMLDHPLDGYEDGQLVLNTIQDMPPVIPSEKQEPQQRTGRWVSYPHQKDRECSICGHSEPYKFADKEAEIFNYCPNCGAKMGGEQDAMSV